jgi:hypothetical protein
LQESQAKCLFFPAKSFDILAFFAILNEVILIENTFQLLTEEQEDG